MAESGHWFPRASQIDPSTMAALPLLMQAEILTSFRSNNNAAASAMAPRQHPHFQQLAPVASRMPCDNPRAIGATPDARAAIFPLPSAPAEEAALQARYQHTVRSWFRGDSMAAPLPALVDIVGQELLHMIELKMLGRFFNLVSC